MRRLLLFVAAAMLPTAPALSWGRYGHDTVAEIAWLESSPVVRARMTALLRRTALLETPDCPARTLGDASIWADCIRGLSPRFSYTNPWHYQNVSVCRPFELTAACKDGNCVSAQIDRNVRLLADRTVPERERVAALLFLIHFVGDLHQPLHAGDDDDRGGNDVRARYGIAGGPRTNLHGVWDTPLAERAITTPAADARGLLASAPADRAALAAGTTEDWSREAWQAAREIAYTPVRGGDPCARGNVAALSEADIEQAIPVIRLQVLRGGVRLARLLQEALG
ncbi:S1/P1 nuclease [Sphingomonas jejuensis]|uniref:S1/P1 nuclease n=1 Tax=Sphingomonas jejuensis TaxID=904715 RepID=UPI003158D6C5